MIMTEDLDETGPIDYLVVEFPGNRMTGEAFPLLIDLVDRGLIRILDFAFVRKDLDGSVAGMVLADLDGDSQLDLAVFEGASSGLLASRGHRRSRDRPPAWQLRRHPGVRERLGSALRVSGATLRRTARGERADPGPGPPGGAGLGRRACQLIPIATSRQQRRKD